MSLIVSVLRASHGDSILIRADANSTKPFLILVDGGPSDCFQKKQGPKIIHKPIAGMPWYPCREQYRTRSCRDDSCG